MSNINEYIDLYPEKASYYMNKTKYMQFICPNPNASQKEIREWTEKAKDRYVYDRMYDDFTKYKIRKLIREYEEKIEDLENEFNSIGKIH